MADDLTSRWRDVAARRYALEPAYVVRAYRNVFAQGFLATPGPTSHEAAPGWRREVLGTWHFQIEPTVVSTVVHGSDGTSGVLVLGEAFDESRDVGIANEHVAHHVLRLVQAHDADQDELDEYISWLSGRFLVFVWHHSELLIWPDPMASRLCYWLNRPGEQALASHTALLSNYVDGLPSEGFEWVWRHPGYTDPFGKWLPALIQPHDEVGQVFANNRLRVSGRTIAHERFFPRRDAEELPFDEAYDLFRAALNREIANWISVKPTTVLALTSGSDSRALLTAGLDRLQDAAAIAMTYHRFDSSNRHSYEDAMAANRLAALTNLRHLVIDVPTMSARSRFGLLYRTTFPTWARFANLAMGLYLNAPCRATLLLGVGAGVGTVHHARREERVISPELLSRTYARCSFGDDPRLHQEMAAWIAYDNFDVENLRGYDFWDFFHWEHRLSKWGAVGYSEYDLALTPATPFNSRRVLHAMLSLPEEDRRSKRLYRQLQEDSKVQP